MGKYTFTWLVLGWLAACGESGPAAGDSDATIDTGSTARARVFVISAFLGDLYVAGGGLAAGDSRCTDEANFAQLGGTWKAWLSTDAVDAKDRITGNGPWYLPDQQTVLFASRADLFVGPAAAIDRGPTNETVGTIPVWTGTTIAGTAATSCTNWTTGTSGTGHAGTTGAATSAWTDDAAIDCGMYAGLYCFEQ